jgi:hypothetical protein
MGCHEHERLNGILIQSRTAVAKLTPVVHDVEFQQSLIEESQALEDLEKHDAEHGCQG